jgi:ATP-dependent exoDNAse (exonuclease V) beta subunit
MGAAADAELIPIETIILPLQPGRPTGRRFGRLVHDILQRADGVEDAIALSRIWGRRHGVSDADCDVAAKTAFSALERVKQLVPQNARRYREMPLVVRLSDGTLVDGRIDLAWSDGSRWTVLDYKTDRREKRRVGQLQLYAVALQRATGLSARGIVLEI